MRGGLWLARGSSTGDNGGVGYRVAISIDDELLGRTNAAARELGISRPEFVRSALAEYLERQRIAELNERDRRGYEAQPQTHDEIYGWDGVQAWPED